MNPDPSSAAIAEAYVSLVAKSSQLGQDRRDGMAFATEAMILVLSDSRLSASDRLLALGEASVGCATLAEMMNPDEDRTPVFMFRGEALSQALRNMRKCLASVDQSEPPVAEASETERAELVAKWASALVSGTASLWKQGSPAALWGVLDTLRHVEDIVVSISNTYPSDDLERALWHGLKSARAVLSELPTACSVVADTSLFDWRELLPSVSKMVGRSAADCKALLRVVKGGDQ